MTWHVLALLLVSLATTGAEGSQEQALSNFADEDEVVLLQTSVRSHRRAEEEDSSRGSASIEESQHRSAQEDSFTRVLHNLMNQGLQPRAALPQEQSGALKLLPTEEPLPQAKLPWEDASLLAEQQPPASLPEPGRPAEAERLPRPGSAVYRHGRRSAASQANLQEQLQTVANQRDAALTQAEQSTEALRVVQEELKLALMTRRQENVLSQATTPFPAEDAIFPKPTEEAPTNPPEPVTANKPTPTTTTTPSTTTTTRTTTIKTTTGEPETLSDALSFNGEVSQTAGIIVWVLLLLLMLCCGSMCCVFTYGLITKSAPNLYNNGFKFARFSPAGRLRPATGQGSKTSPTEVSTGQGTRGPQRAVPPSLKSEKQGPKTSASSVFADLSSRTICGQKVFDEGLNLDCC